MAESTTAATVSLVKKQGSRYQAIVWLEPKVWQHEELLPEDCIPTEGALGPRDPHNKLDLDQIAAIEISYRSQVSNASAGDQIHFAMDSHSGPQKFFMDDFEVSADRPAWWHVNSPSRIDCVDYPQLQWFIWAAHI